MLLHCENTRWKQADKYLGASTGLLQQISQSSAALYHQNSV